MLLSEAIRLGSLLHEQGFGELVDRRGRTCAAGAALEAVGALPCYGAPYDTEGLMKRHFPIWHRLAWKHVAGHQHGFADVGEVILWLNDTLHWSREAIADWVEEVEQAGRQDKAEAQEEVPCA